MAGFDPRIPRRSPWPDFGATAPYNGELPHPFNMVNMAPPQPDASMGYSPINGRVQPYNIDEEATFLNEQTPSDFPVPSSTGVGPGLAYGSVAQKAPAALQASPQASAPPQAPQAPQANPVRDPFSLGGILGFGTDMLGKAAKAVLPGGTGWSPVAHADEKAPFSGGASGNWGPTPADQRQAYREGKTKAEYDASRLSETAARNESLLDTLRRADQTRALNQQRQERQASLPDYKEYSGENSEPGSLFYKMDGPRKASAFGQPITHMPQGGGTLSQSPMGDRAAFHEDNRVATEDATSVYKRRVAEGRAEDPFGTQQYIARQGFLQSRKQAIDNQFFEAKTRLDQALAAKQIPPEQYQSTLDNLQYERRFQHEEIDPKGGFERLTQSQF